ncbi:MAG TPA: alanine--tRNA ligase [Planctomycetota bacterium]|nr:alanine--tRNA ligase [Planctomycetota bacterium]
MRRLTVDELRQSYLDFFVQRGHTLVASDSLVPTYDPSLLFTGAGMNQFKDEFLGKGKRPLKRGCSSQKCIRTGDIGNVGVTAAHHTFFEMLGNFSFGDYFKREAIKWAWEFYTKVLEMPEEKLSISVYKDDQEAYDIWAREVGIPASKIYRFDAHDNFWPADAPTESPKGTLCGPCSEIFFDLGPNDCRNANCSPACDCRRHVEIWNLVFQQFEKGAAANELVPLPQKNIDTGAGLERNAAVLQGAATNFEIDSLLPLVEEALRLADAAAGQKYVGRYAELRKAKAPAGELLPVLRRARRIADHARAVTFCLSDGVLPSNEGRGYVVRRLLRRAVLDGRALGVKESFVHTLVAPVARLMARAYPEVGERAGNLARLVRAEEESFEATLERGLGILREKIAGAAGGTLGGRDAFTLYDTYGFPVEITEEILAEQGMKLDRAGFEKAMEEQRERARAGSKMVGVDIFGGVMAKVKGITKGTRFERGWPAGQTAKVLAIIKGNDLLAEARSGGEVQVVLDRTPFYGESGGQVGDTGALRASGGKALVLNATKVDEIVLHHVRVEGGVLRPGDGVEPVLDPARRAAIEANHTATHILHHYLRQVLGQHVEQSGSLVDGERLRLDFTHFEGTKPEELRRVEELVNKAIRSGGAVRTTETTVDQARKAGAMALFGEKYGERVRMVETDLGGGERSVELCGGTHLERAADARLFRIEKEESVAAGIRRITATTGAVAEANAEADRRTLGEIGALLGLPGGFDAAGDPAGAASRDRLGELCALVKCQREALKDRVTELVKRSGADAKALAALPADAIERVKALQKLAKEAEKKQQASRASDLAGRGKEIAAAAEKLPSGALFASAALEGIGPDDLRRLSDEVRTALPSGVVFLASSFDGKALLVASVSDDLVKAGKKAGDIVKAAAKEVGGGGGGKPNMAQAGGPNAANIPAAVAAARKLAGG